MNSRRWFWAAVALQMLLLAALAGRHGYTLVTGRPVLLETMPLEPWEAASGEEVTLRYAIGTLAAERVTMEGAPYRQGQRVWVTLRPGESHWRAEAVSARRPEVGPDRVAVRGRVISFGEPPPAGEAVLHLRYGLERLYLPEGTEVGPGAALTVEAVVDAFGRAALRRVFLDGQEIPWR